MPQETITPSSELVFAENLLCPVQCSGSCTRPWRKVSDAMGSGPFAQETFRIWRCETCDIGLTDPVPTEATSHLLYDTRESNDFQPHDSAAVTALKAFAARSDIRKVLRDVPVPDGGYVLDFGCGDGAFVRAISEVHPRVKSIGTDSHTTPPPSLNKDSYLSYEQLRGVNRKFDVILCRHVLEHTYAPVETLKFLRTLLSGTGVLIIEVPSLEASVKSIFGKYWDGYYVPYHPLHFTRKSLAVVLNRAGFDVIRQGGAEMPKMGRSIRNVLGCRYGLWLFVFGMLLQPVQVGIGLLTRSSVCLRAWARPAES